LLLLGCVLVHFGCRLLTLNPQLLKLELLVFLELGFVTDIDDVLPKKWSSVGEKNRAR